MLDFQKFTLDNGLRVIIHEDPSTPMVCVNILYDVGARDEDPEQTGFAHLFEHLMFGGSVNVPNFDAVLQGVGGQNNAFTSNDITNYYITLPAHNIETALWLESDRMLGLTFEEKGLATEKQVVIEEFKQRYLNQPYGNVMILLRELSYKQHPYRWPTIGKEISHIEKANLDSVKDFFYKHYSPQNAILSIVGNVKYEEVKSKVKKWFGDIPKGNKYDRQITKEPIQNTCRKLEVLEDIPVDALYMAFHGPSKHESEYYTLDLVSDILSRGSSSRLYQSLVKEKKIFSEINATLTGSIDSNLLIIEGKLAQGFSVEEGEENIWLELGRLTQNLLDDKELQKVKNKVESTMVFAELSILDKAMNLAYFELLGEADSYNQEFDMYEKVQPSDILKLSKTIFNKNNCNTIYYKSKYLHETK